MDLFIGIALVIIVFISSNIIEKRLKTIATQNSRIIELLEEINKNNKLKS